MAILLAPSLKNSARVNADNGKGMGLTEGAGSFSALEMREGEFQLMIWSIYMVRRKDKKIYTGITIDIARRFEEHKGAGTKGSKFLRGRGPLELLVVMPVGNRGDALRVEQRVKRLSRSRKEDIIREPAILSSFIEDEKKR